MTLAHAARPANEARLRAHHQLTLPDAVVQAAGLVEGDRFIVDVDPHDPDVVRLRIVRASYSGTLADVYGDGIAALAEERAQLAGPGVTTPESWLSTKRGGTA